MLKDLSAGERYPTNAHKQFLLCLLIPLHVSASRCHLQGVTISLFISYSRLSAFRVGVGYCSSGVVIILRMCFACWIPKATNTHSECIIRVAFPTATTVARTCLNDTLYLNFLSCLAWHNTCTILKPLVQVYNSIWIFLLKYILHS
jgi:hypothetical protein